MALLEEKKGAQRQKGPGARGRTKEEAQKAKRPKEPRAQAQKGPDWLEVGVFNLFFPLEWAVPFRP